MTAIDLFIFYILYRLRKHLYFSNGDSPNSILLILLLPNLYYFNLLFIKEFPNAKIVLMEL